MNPHLTPEVNREALSSIGAVLKCENEFLPGSKDEDSINGIRTRVGKRERTKINAIKSYRRKVGARRV